MDTKKNRLRTLISYIRWSFFFSNKSIFLNITGSDRPKRAPRVNVDFRFASLADILALPNGEFDYDKESKIYAGERLNSGDQAVIGYIDNQPVFYCWMMYGEIDLHYRCYRPLSEKSVYSYKSYTKETHRGQGIFNDYYLFILNYWEGLGYHHVYNFVDIANIPSLKINEKVGFFKVGKLITIGALGRTLSYIRLDNSITVPKIIEEEFHQIGKLSLGKENPL